jgi:endonuclease/exonuclease/phosphatase family metal-dependent hydrolase
VHRCLGLDGRIRPERIAEVLRRCAPDIVALQELDVGRQRSGLIDQAHEIASALNMQFHFHPALHVFEEKYGDAILTAGPSHLVKAGALPSTSPAAEPRGALWVCTQIGGRRIDIINTHFGLASADRRLQAETITGEPWLKHVASHPAVIVVGDFNSIPQSRAYRRLARNLADAHAAAKTRAVATFPSMLPLLRLDHMFVGPAIAVTHIETVRSRLARIASDHLPLVMDFHVTGTA